MNTLSYLSSLFLPTTRNVTPPQEPEASSRAKPVTSTQAEDPSQTTIASTSAETTSTTSTNKEGLVDSGTTTLTSAAAAPPGSTIYLSARRKRLADGSVDEDEPLHVRWSTNPPDHLVGLIKTETGGTTRASLNAGGEERKEDRGEEETAEEQKRRIITAEEEELRDAEQRHQRKEREFQQRIATVSTKPSSSSPGGPVRISIPGLTSLWTVVRIVLAFFRVPYTSSRSRKNTLIGASGEEGAVVGDKEGEDPIVEDELSQRLEKATMAKGEEREAPVTTTSSFFFKRKPAGSASLSSRSTPTWTTIKPIVAVAAPPRLTPKTLVLDLDETLIHSTSRPYANSKRSAGLKVRVVEVVLEGRSTVYTVYKRPWVDYFLRKVSSWYTVIIFTASLPEYADPVIDWLDGGDGGGGMVGGRLFRSDCLHSNGAYVKDLSVVDADLSRVCLVDNSPVSYAINQANGIPIEGWINDPNDECLLDLLPMLDSLRFTNDVRRVLGLRGFGK